MNRSKPETRTVSEQVAMDAMLERQRELIRDLHDLLSSYGPPWYTEEMDTRLSEVAKTPQDPGRNF